MSIGYQVTHPDYILPIADRMGNSSHITNYREMRSHKDLDAWKKSMDLVDSIYKVSKLFPNEELYSLTNQMRREERQFLFLRTLQKEGTRYCIVSGVGGCESGS